MINIFSCVANFNLKQLISAGIVFKHNKFPTEVAESTVNKSLS